MTIFLLFAGALDKVRIDLCGELDMLGAGASTSAALATAARTVHRAIERGV